MTQKRKTARDFGDNPNIRRKHGEATRINLKEPWERQYRGIKKSETFVDAHVRVVNGKRTKVKGHLRKF